jgi:hypothetical protein
MTDFFPGVGTQSCFAPTSRLAPADRSCSNITAIAVSNIHVVLDQSQIADDDTPDAFIQPAAGSSCKPNNQVVVDGRVATVQVSIIPETTSGRKPSSGIKSWEPLV